MDQNEIVRICQEALDNVYEYGSNDCNIVALRIVDSISGSDWEKECTYTTFIGGMRVLKKLGFESTADIIRECSDEVQVAIDGDIWVDPSDNHALAIVISDRLLGVDSEHTKFKLIPKRKEGTYYRIRK